MKGLEKFTIDIYLQPSQIEFAKSLILPLPGTWEEHKDRLLASLAIVQLNRLMYERLSAAELEPKPIDRVPARSPESPLDHHGKETSGKGEVTEKIDSREGETGPLHK